MNVLAVLNYLQAGTILHMGCLQIKVQTLKFHVINDHFFIYTPSKKIIQLDLIDICF